jgi:hypothetical protein
LPAGTEEAADWFDYYLEPKELEVQLGHLAHNIVETFRRRRDKGAVLDALKSWMNLDAAGVADLAWTQTLLWREMFGAHRHFLQILAAPPPGSDRRRTGAAWRALHQKLYNLWTRLSNLQSEAINSSMSKFDRAYDLVMESLRLESRYRDSTMSDNVRLVVRMLRDHDWMRSDEPLGRVVDRIMTEPSQVKTIVLDADDAALPPLKIELAGGETDFELSVVDVSDPASRETFQNDMLETVFSNMIDYIQRRSMERLSSASAVETLPAPTGANAQGAGSVTPLPPAASGGSALPAV